MDIISLSIVVAIIVFAVMLAKGRGLWNALGSACAVIVGGILLTMTLMIVSGLAVGAALAAVIGGIVLFPLMILLLPVLCLVGLIWLIGSAGRKAV